MKATINLVHPEKLSRGDQVFVSGDNGAMSKMGTVYKVEIDPCYRHVSVTTTVENIKHITVFKINDYVAVVDAE